MSALPNAVLCWLRGIDATARAMAYAVELDARPVTDAIERVWELDATSRGPTLAAGLAADLHAIEGAVTDENPRGVDSGGPHDPGGLHGWLQDLIWERQKAAAAAWLDEARAIMNVECVR